MHELLMALPPGGRVLDLGCSKGSFRFQHGAAEELPFPDEMFDLIIANFVFEHTSDFARAISEAERVLARGGSLYMSVPNAKSFEDELYRALFAGGGHRQRFGLETILRAVYAHTGLKLMAFADWPAGFTFFEHREGLRQFTLAVVDVLRRSVNADISLRSNFILTFQKVARPATDRSRRSARIAAEAR